MPPGFRSRGSDGVGLLTSNEIIGGLEALGYRVTEPRRRLIELLGAHRGHFSADEFHREAQASGLTTGRATVFRTLDLLAQNNLIERVPGEESSRRYAVCSAGHHHHLVCTTCDTVVAFDECLLEGQARAISRAFNFEVAGHRLEFYGRCGRCRALDERAVEAFDKPTDVAIDQPSLSTHPQPLPQSDERNRPTYRPLAG